MIMEKLGEKLIELPIDKVLNFKLGDKYFRAFEISEKEFLKGMPK